VVYQDALEFLRTKSQMAHLTFRDQILHFPMPFVVIFVSLAETLPVSLFLQTYR